jgi:hypothetical protein
MSYDTSPYYDDTSPVVSRFFGGEEYVIFPDGPEGWTWESVTLEAGGGYFEGIAEAIADAEAYALETTLANGD